MEGTEKMFVADFYCHEARLVIEVDGEVHTLQAEADANRDEWMRASGLRVIRVSNGEIESDLEGFLLGRLAKVVNAPPGPLS